MSVSRELTNSSQLLAQLKQDARNQLIPLHDALRDCDDAGLNTAYHAVNGAIAVFRRMHENL
ncbi:MAG: hypothetical protein QM809_03490 [Gordonia sp. (in: high G+C Gram-positive bacteria)]|uniref:hypothetical protein n=1 Tax=Gordonia sp. (in: high G+C Gram-positive bacteria) TaxID=84139 RepID=UPI0039E593B4